MDKEGWYHVGFYCYDRWDAFYNRDMESLRIIMEKIKSSQYVVKGSRKLILENHYFISRKLPKEIVFYYKIFDHTCDYGYENLCVAQKRIMLFYLYIGY